MENSGIIYLNNAATSWPKPQCVINAIKDYFTHPPINSSRNCNCIKYKDDIDNICRQKLAEFFHVDLDKWDVIITNGATYSSNIIINWLKTKYKYLNLITDNWQHNSIYRTHFEKVDLKPVFVKNWDNIDKELNNVVFKDDMPSITNYYCALTQENNVDGTLLNDNVIKKVLNYFKKHGNIPVILDATQSAGTYDINITDYDYDNLYVIGSGHKGLYSVTGIGYIIAPKDKIDVPFISGGTGNAGLDYEHTGSLEAGTPNELAMCSLIAGLDFITSTTLETIRSWKQTLVENFLLNYTNVNNRFKEVFELVPCTNTSSGIVCFKMLNKLVCTEIISKLSKEHQIMVRSGVHCAPLYHINVLKCESTLRISFGYFNKIQDVTNLINAINSIYL